MDVLGLTTDEDNDGNGGADVEKISDEQFNELMKLKDAGKVDVQKFCEFMGVETIRDIPEKQFGMAKMALQQKAPK